MGRASLKDNCIRPKMGKALILCEFWKYRELPWKIFNNRVEIISPGLLPNTLSIGIKTGVHVVRNPILLSHCKDIPSIPYRGMGIGGSRILKSCVYIQ